VRSAEVIERSVTLGRRERIRGVRRMRENLRKATAAICFGREKRSGFAVVVGKCFESLVLLVIATVRWRESGSGTVLCELES